MTKPIWIHDLGLLPTLRNPSLKGASATNGGFSNVRCDYQRISPLKKVMLPMKTTLNCCPFQWIKFECSLYRLPWLTRLQPKIWSSWGQQVEMLVAVHCFKNMLAIKQSGHFISSSVRGFKCPERALPIWSTSASWSRSREVDHLKCWLYGA